MSSRERRSVAQPSNYKTYSETGTDTGSQGSEGLSEAVVGQSTQASHPTDGRSDPSSPDISSQQTNPSEQDIVNVHADILDTEFNESPTPQARKKPPKKDKNKENGGARPKVRQHVSHSRDLLLPPPIKHDNAILNNVNKLQDEAKDYEKTADFRSANDKKKQLVQMPEGYDGYYTVSDSDNEPNIAQMYDQHLKNSKQARAAKQNKNVGAKSAKNHTAVKQASVKENIVGDNMNEYLDANIKEVQISPPHTKIPAKNKKQKQTLRQQELIDEIVNSDDLSYSRDTGMAYKKKKGKKQDKRDTRDRRRVVKKADSPPPRRTHHKTASTRWSRSPARRQRGYDREEPWRRRDRSDSTSTHTGESDTSSSTSTSQESEESDSTEVETSPERHPVRHHRKNKKRVKSGILAKPSNRVKKELIYPHFSLCQGGAFVATEVTYAQLTYEQFMAGETHTILRCRSAREKEGRLRLLSALTRWRLRSSVAWAQIKSAYAVILRDIENGIARWEDDFYSYQHLLLEKPQLPTKTKSANGTANAATKTDFQWFCKAFQRPEGCSLQPPHAARIGNRDRVVHHYCAKCYISTKIRRYHSEASTECPLYEH